MSKQDPRTGTARNVDRHRPDGPPQRKVRLADEVWNEAKERAGVPDKPKLGDRNMTQLIEELLQAYADGRVRGVDQQGEPNMRIVQKTSAEKLNDLLAEVAVTGGEWLEALEAGEGIPGGLHFAYLNAIDDYTQAAREHNEQETILCALEGERRVVTMDEIEEIKRREREERGEGE